VFGDGPERGAVLEAIADAGPDAPVEAPGFVEGVEVEQTLARAACMLLPSQREGYGMIVVEAAAHGVPSVVVREPDNAAIELVDDGENGVIAASAEPDDLAAAIVRVCEAGDELRARTAAWYERNAAELSLESSLDVVIEAYDAAAASASRDSVNTAS
jgi:glycosyltransferase involved in cell wall biosynthesis